MNTDHKFVRTINCSIDKFKSAKLYMYFAYFVNLLFRTFHCKITSVFLYEIYIISENSKTFSVNVFVYSLLLTKKHKNKLKTLLVTISRA